MATSALTLDEGAYTNPETAPHKVPPNITSSGVPGDSGLSDTSSAFK
jgi:hypothetical protein